MTIIKGLENYFGVKNVRHSITLRGIKHFTAVDTTFGNDVEIKVTEHGDVYTRIKIEGIDTDFEKETRCIKVKKIIINRENLSNRSEEELEMGYALDCNGIKWENSIVNEDNIILQDANFETIATIDIERTEINLILRVKLIS